MDTQKLYGFDMFKESSPSEVPVLTVEDWDYDINQFLDSLKPDEVGIYVLDSLDSLSSREMEDLKEDRRTAIAKGKEYDDGSYAMSAAKLLSQQLFRGLSDKLEAKNALLYIISQERDNVGAIGYAKKNKLGGGRAIGFYETVRVYSKLKAKEEKKGRTTSVLIDVSGEKVRHPRPFRSCNVSVDFLYGMDDISDCIDFLYDLRTAEKGDLKEKACASIEWDDVVLSRAELIQHIEEKKLKKELRRRVIEKWEEIEQSITTIRSNKYEED
jgi:hypothetical protein